MSGFLNFAILKVESMKNFFDERGEGIKFVTYVSFMLWLLGAKIMATMRRYDRAQCAGRSISDLPRARRCESDTSVSYYNEELADE